MPDLIRDLQDAGLSEDQARKACRVVAEWIGDTEVITSVQVRVASTWIDAATVGNALAAIRGRLREAGETP